MDDPLSYTAGIMAGMGLIVLAGCISLLLSDAEMLHSLKWWMFVLVATVVSSDSIFSYFRTSGVAIVLPLLLAASLWLVLDVWYVRRMLLASESHPTARQIEFGLVLCAGWPIWLYRTIGRVRKARETAHAAKLI